MYLFDARLTADHELARKLQAGVGDDIVVELLVDGEVVGYVTVAAYDRMQQGDDLHWPPLSALRRRVEAAASGPLHFNTLGRG